MLQAFIGNVPSIPDFKSLLRCSDVALARSLRSPPLLSHHSPLLAYATRGFSVSFCAPWLVQAGPFYALFTCAPARESGWSSGYQPLWALGLFICSRSAATTVSSFNSTVLGSMSCEAVSASPLRIPETSRWLYEVTGISPSLFHVKT